MTNIVVILTLQQKLISLCKNGGVHPQKIQIKITRAMTILIGKNMDKNLLEWYKLKLS